MTDKYTGMKSVINMKRIFLAIGAAAMLASCANDGSEPVRGGEGTIAIGCGVDCDIMRSVGVVTRADDKTELSDMNNCPVPTVRRILVTSLTEGIEYNEVFSSPTTFNDIDYNPRLEAGDYMVTIGSTSPLCNWKTASGADVSAKEAPTHPQLAELIPQCAEGENLPYLLGREHVTVVAGDHDKQVEVTMGIINSAVCIQFTDAFKRYFEQGATVNLTTKAGNTFTVKYTKEEQSALKYFWIRPEEFTVSGTARRQQPSPDILEATPVTIKEHKISNVAPRTLYTVRFDVENVGGRGVSVYINDTPADTLVNEVELNPIAPSNLKEK